MDESICELPAEQCLNVVSCRCRNEFGINIHFRSLSSRELLAPRIGHQQWCLTVPNQESDILLELCTKFDSCIELADGEVSEKRFVEAGEALQVSLKDILAHSKTGLSGLIDDLRDLMSPGEGKVARLPEAFSIKVWDSNKPRILRATYNIKLDMTK